MVITDNHHKNMQFFLILITIAFMSISILNIIETRKYRKEELARDKKNQLGRIV